MKSIFSLLLAAVIAVTPVQKAHSTAVATAASFGSASALMYLPYAALFGGGFAFITAKNLRDFKKRGRSLNTFQKVLGFVLIGAGLIVLDDEGTQKVAFNQLSDEEALKLGKGLNSVKKFNTRVSAIDQIAKSIGKTCIKKLVAVKGKEVLEQAQLSEEDINMAARCNDNAWKAYQKKNPQILSQDVFEVVQAIRHQAAK